MQEAIGGELAAMLAKRRQRSEGNHGSSSPQVPSAPSAPQILPKPLQHNVHGPSAAAHLTQVGVAVATSMSDARRATLEGGCMSANEVAVGAEAKAEPTMDAASVQATEEKKPTHISAQAYMVEKMEVQARKKREQAEAAAESAREEAAQGFGAATEDKTVHRTQEQMDEPEAEVKEHLPAAEESEAETPEATVATPEGADITSSEAMMRQMRQSVFQLMGKNMQAICAHPPSTAHSHSTCVGDYDSCKISAKEEATEVYRTVETEKTLNMTPEQMEEPAAGARMDPLVAEESEKGLSELESDEEMPVLYDPAAAHKCRQTSSSEVY